MVTEATVFVVDDEPAVLAALTALIRVDFPRVEAYSSPAEFLAAFDPQRAGCLVLDLSMPEMTGLELQEKLAEADSPLPVVFITGYGTVSTAVRAMQAGAVDFLEKPLRQGELAGSIRRALELDEKNRRRQARHAEIGRRMATLSPGEREVLDLIVAGKLNKEIAAALDLNVRTIEDRRARLMRKLGAGSVADLVHFTFDPTAPATRSSPAPGSSSRA